MTAKILNEEMKENSIKEEHFQYFHAAYAWQIDNLRAKFTLSIKPNLFRVESHGFQYYSREFRTKVEREIFQSLYKYVKECGLAVSFFLNKVETTCGETVTTVGLNAAFELYEADRAIYPSVMPDIIEMDGIGMDQVLAIYGLRRAIIDTYSFRDGILIEEVWNKDYEELLYVSNNWDKNIPVLGPFFQWLKEFFDNKAGFMPDAYFAAYDLPRYQSPFSTILAKGQPNSSDTHSLEKSTRPIIVGDAYPGKNSPKPIIGEGLPYGRLMAIREILIRFEEWNPGRPDNIFDWENKFKEYYLAHGVTEKVYLDNLLVLVKKMQNEGIINVPFRDFLRIMVREDLSQIALKINERDEGILFLILFFYHWLKNEPRFNHWNFLCRVFSFNPSFKPITEKAVSQNYVRWIKKMRLPKKLRKENPFSAFLPLPPVSKNTSA